jgi:carboxyl-terminal processing protease
MHCRRWATSVLCVCLCLSVVKASVADDLGPERDRMKMVLNAVAGDVKKNYYDPDLKGLDWKALTDQTKQKIDNAKSISEMLTAIYSQIDKLHDSHTKFLPPFRATKLYYGFDAKAIGDDIRIFEIKKGDPADRAGLQVGDKIIKMNGFGADRASFDTMMWYFRQLRPMPKWELVVQTDDAAPRTVLLEARQKMGARVVEQSTQMGDIWDLISESNEYEETHKFQTAAYKETGYVWLREFPGEGEDFLKGLMEKVQGSKAIIIDLRSNGGGAINTLRNFIGVFESSEVKVLDEVYRKKTEEMIAKPQRPNFAGLPMYILIDSRTGSSAEVFARHFQRTKKAVILGDQSMGRVVTSRQFGGEIGDRNAILFSTQISVARMVFPDGEELEGKGVKPDVYCVPTGEDMREDRDPCVQKALSLAREKLGVKPKIAENKVTVPSGN